MSGCAIRNTIRDLRFNHGEMTQQALADRVGVTRQTVNAIELGKYSPSLEVSFRIARVFGVPLEEVFSYPQDDGAARFQAPHRLGIDRRHVVGAQVRVACRPHALGLVDVFQRDRNAVQGPVIEALAQLQVGLLGGDPRALSACHRAAVYCSPSHVHG